MSVATKLGLGVLMLAVTVCYVGCQKNPPAAAPTTTTQPAPSTPMPAPQPPIQNEEAATTEGNPAAEPGVEGGATPAEGDQTMSAEVKANLASLSVEDRELAVKQKICPVSGEALGAMGTPIKLTVAGQDVLICCEHCEEPLKKEPATYLAKIGLKPTEEAAK